jgi:hypothetical protein
MWDPPAAAGASARSLKLGGPRHNREERRVREHDVLVGFRLRLFTLAEELGHVSAARRAMGLHRSTYYG